MTSIFYFTRFRGKNKFALFAKEEKLFCYKSNMKWVTALIALSLLFLLSDVTHASKLEETLQATERKLEVFFSDFYKLQHTMMTGQWNNKANAVKIQIPSLALEIKIILTHDKDSIDVNGKPHRHSKPKLVQIFKCKNIPQYPENTTCAVYEIFELTHPELTTRMQNFTLRTMTRAQDFIVAVITGTWKKCRGVTRTVADKIGNGVEYIWTGMAEWTSGKFTWFLDLTWNGAKWFGEMVWNWAECLAKFVWTGIQWLAEFTINGAYWFAEMARDKAAELVEMMLNGIVFITKPFVPVFTYVSDVAVEFYTGYLLAHVKNVQARFVFLSWKDGVYAIFAGLAVNFALLVVYRLVLRTASFIHVFIGRKWQDYKDRRAAANLPPEPKKPIWRPKQKKKKKNNDKW